MMFDIHNRTKPILKWAGGKSGLLSQILPLFPGEFLRYVEPFMGAGAVFLSLNKDIPAVINDFNSELTHLYEVIRDFPEAFLETIQSMKSRYCESYYYELRKTYFTNPIERAARTLFLNKTGFNGLYRTNTSGEFNVPFGHRPHCPRIIDPKNLMRVSQRLKSATLYNLDFEKVIDQCGAGDFIYCDPPYIPLNPSSNFHQYLAGGFCEFDHLRLSMACIRAQSRGAIIAISNSQAPRVQMLYSDWQSEIIMARRAINSRGTLRGRIEEVLLYSKPLKD